MSELVQSEFKFLPSVQFVLLLALIATYAVGSYWYIPNRVPADQREKTQLYTSVAFTLATNLVYTATYINNIYERPAIIIRKVNK